MKAARVVDPAGQPDKSRIWFGATVELADDDDARRVVTLVGDDEAEAGEGRIGWNSPLARALRGAAVGDLRTVQLPAGPKDWEVMAVDYPAKRSEEHTYELQSLMRISYAVFCLKKKKNKRAEMRKKKTCETK